MQTEAEPYEEIFCVSVRDEPEGAEVKMPKEPGRVNFRQVGELLDKDESVMGLGLASVSGHEGGGRVFRRLGLVRWVRKELFFGEEVSVIKII